MKEWISMGRKKLSDTTSTVVIEVEANEPTDNGLAEFTKKLDEIISSKGNKEDKE